MTANGFKPATASTVSSPSGRSPTTQTNPEPSLVSPCASGTSTGTCSVLAVLAKDFQVSLYFLMSKLVGVPILMLGVAVSAGAVPTAPMPEPSAMPELLLSLAILVGYIGWRRYKAAKKQVGSAS